MAQAARVAALSDDLVESIVGDLQLQSQDALRLCKERAIKRLKQQHRYGQTNQFQVRSSLEGLIEKFSVLNRDDLADALQKRLSKLEKHKHKWKPEILSLLLSLSDRPVEKTVFEGLDAVHEPSQAPFELTWEQIIEEEPLSDNSIWEQVDFAGSSDEDEPLSDSLDEGDQTQDTALSAKSAYEERRDKLIIKPDLQILDPIQRAQNEILNGSARTAITELQAIKEICYALQGFPSILFQWDRKRLALKASMRYALEGLSQTCLHELLTSLVNIVVAIQSLRQFVEKQQSEPVLQTFTSGVESELSTFAQRMCALEEQYTISHQGPVVVSILALERDIRISSQALEQIHQLIIKVQPGPSESVVPLLDALHERLCFADISEDWNMFRGLSVIFFLCLNTYMRAVRTWMTEGCVVNDEPFFVQERTRSVPLEDFWHEKYTLRANPESSNAPLFLGPFISEIFESGKHVSFLKLLGYSLGDPTPPKSLAFDEMTGQSGDSWSIPFSEKLEYRLLEWIQAQRQDSSMLIRDVLTNQCGLNSYLEALTEVYLSTNGSKLDSFASEVFKRIDRGSSNWNDPDFLEDAANAAFRPASYTHELAFTVTARPPKLPYNSLKSLSSIAIEYKIPWSLANVIRPSSMQTYQRVFCLLLQIHRAKSHLVTERLIRSVDLLNAYTSRESRTAVYVYLRMRHRCLWFLEVIKEYMSIAIASTIVELQQRVATAATLNDIVKAHAYFISILEVRCLLSQALAPLHDAILGMLELGVQFAGSWNEFRGHRHNHQPKDENEDDAESSESDNETSENTDWIETSKPILQRSQNAAAAISQFKAIQIKYSELLSLLISGLQSLSRGNEGDVLWRLLSEKLTSK